MNFMTQVCHSYRESENLITFVCQVDTFKKMGWVLRPQAYEIISQLRDAETEHYSNRFLICILRTGRVGVPGVWDCSGVLVCGPSLVCLNAATSRRG